MCKALTPHEFVANAGNETVAAPRRELLLVLFAILPRLPLSEVPWQIATTRAIFSCFGVSNACVAAMLSRSGHVRNRGLCRAEGSGAGAARGAAAARVSWLR